jgi:uncharacterized cupin superfamily protein
MSERPIINLADVPLREQGHGEGFCVKLARLGPTLGLTGLGCTLHVVPPGRRAFPLHRHNVLDELFYILAGSGTYRCGAETLPIRAGDVIGAAAGTSPHQIINSGAEDLRYLAVSTMGGVDVVEYPDSRKFAVAAGIRKSDFKTASFVHIGRAGESLDYWDGEDH